MGYARIFWVREEPIRAHIASRGRTDALLEEVGGQVLSLAVKNNVDMPHSGKLGPPLPLFDTPSVFFPFRSFHSTESHLLFWTGTRLVALHESRPAVVESLLKLMNTVGSAHVRVPVVPDPYLHSVGHANGRGASEPNAWASLYYLYEDFARDYAYRPMSEWPRREVGAATLKLMLSDTTRSARIEDFVNALSRCCSFAQPECALFVWGGNCLRLVSEIRPGELERIREELGRDGRG